MNISMLRGYFKEIDICKHYHQKNVVTDPIILLNEIECIVRNRKKISETLLNARVFINNGTRDDFGYRISNSPPYNDENLHEWLQRITGENSFCAVINGINGWSDILAEIINRNFNTEWVNTYGIPSQGVDVYTFMGKYDITPFGIHKDQEHTFLYHLGPGVKKAWIWDPSLVDITPFIQSDTFNLAETLSCAYAITLTPGDALFIPQNWYHVLENPEFSVTLGVAPYESKKKELLVSFVREAIEEDDDSYLFIKSPQVIGPKEYALEIVPPSIKDANLIQIADQGVSRLLNTLKSNHYFKYTSPVRNIKPKIYKYFGGIEIGDSEGITTRVYLRGRSFVIKNEFRESFIKLRKLVNSEDFQFNGEESLPDDVISFFLKKMASMGVLV